MSARRSTRAASDQASEPDLFADDELMSRRPDGGVDRASPIPPGPNAFNAANDDTATHKQAPETLELRRQPQPVKRLSPRAIIVLCTIGSLFVAGVTLSALRKAKPRNADKPTELYESETKPKSDQLASLPTDYAAWMKKVTGSQSATTLGPPASGDVGNALAIQERQLGIDPRTGTSVSNAGGEPFTPNGLSDATRAQTIERMRVNDQALSSGLFFTSHGGSQVAKPTAENPNDVEHILERLAGGGGAGPSAATPASNASPSDAALLPAAPDQTASQDAFLSRNPRDESSVNPHALTKPVSPYMLMAGTVIPAALITGLNSDLPGMIEAHVTENVYDSVTGKHLLIPQGARLLGRYDARIGYGQHRALIVWQRLILPDGASMLLDNMNGTDAQGQSGLDGKTDEHGGQLLKGILLSSILGVGTELSLGNQNGNSLQALAHAIQNSSNQAGQRSVERALDVKPTIHVAPGTRLNVLVSKDLVLKPLGEPNQPVELEALP